MTTTTTADLYATEHARGLHEKHYAPPGCPECPQPPPGSTAALKASFDQLHDQVALTNRQAEHGNLAPALERLRRGFIVDQLDEPDLGPQAPDGNPWCERCRGGRQLAVRVGREPTTYVACPDCKRAPWRIAKQHERLDLTVPERFKACRLGTFPTFHPGQRDTIERLRAWLLDPEPSWLFLFGPTGCGKTGLAVGLLYALADLGNVPAFSIITDLLSTIKASFGSVDGESESSILDVLYAADVFVLDDLGSEYHRGSEDWTSEKIFQLIAGRHAAMKRTIITSNLSLDQLQTKLGHPRTVRRIVEATTPRWIVDFRRLPQIAF